MRRELSEAAEDQEPLQPPPQFIPVEAAWGRPPDLPTSRPPDLLLSAAPSGSAALLSAAEPETGSMWQAMFRNAPLPLPNGFLLSGHLQAVHAAATPPFPLRGVRRWSLRQCPDALL